MSEYLTYAAVRTDDFQSLLKQCVKNAHKLGVRFEVPTKPTPEAHTWVGVFENGWVFAMADPAVWELLDIFAKLAKDQGLDYLSGATEGSFNKWGYDFAAGGDVQHRFLADPSLRVGEDEYHLYTGDPAALAHTFDVSRIRLQRMLRQFNATNVQEFHELLGFTPDRAKSVRFVIVGPGTYSNTATYLVDNRSPAGASTTSIGETTLALSQIILAAGKGLGAAANAKAARYSKESNWAEAQDMVMRLQKAGRHEAALAAVDALIKRAEQGEFERLPHLQREERIATIHAMRGLALFDLDRTDEAIIAIRDHALSVNRYVGPSHRAAIAGRLGTLLVQRGNYQEALEPLRLCLAERPLQTSTWAALARAAHRCGRTFEARQAALQGLAAGPDYAGWPGILREVGMQRSDGLPERDPKLSKAFRREAKELMRTGQKQQALAKFRLSLHHSPTDLDCVWGVACAIAECLRDGVIEMDEEDREVIRLLEQVCYGNPPWPWSWGTLAEVLMRFGERERAKQAVHAYARVHVARVEDLLDVSLWLARLNPEMGVEILEVLLERFIELRLRGSASYDEARDTSKAKALGMLGWALLELERPVEALEYLIQASQSDSSNADNWATLAETHVTLGNAAAARRALSRGLKCDPKHKHLKTIARKLPSQLSAPPRRCTSLAARLAVHTHDQPKLRPMVIKTDFLMDQIRQIAERLAGGRSLVRKGKLAEAGKLVEELLEECERLRETQDGDPLDKMEAELLSEMALLASARGDVASGERYLAQALALMAPLVAAQPEDARLIGMLTTLELNYGAMLAATRRFEEARTTLTSVIERLGARVEHSAPTPQLTHMWISALQNRALAAEQAGDVGAALDDCRQAREGAATLEGPSAVRAQIDLALRTAGLERRAGRNDHALETLLTGLDLAEAAIHQDAATFHPMYMRAKVAVADAYFASGQFCEGEDHIFEAIERMPEVVDTVLVAADMYSALLIKDDAELNAGGLPRVEVEESFAEVLANLDTRCPDKELCRLVRARFRVLTGHADDEARALASAAIGPDRRLELHRALQGKLKAALELAG